MSDTLRIELENIQAIEKATIEVEGYTAIVGRSNSGKSCIIRGVSAALSNKSPKSIFRRGTKKSRVALHDDARDIHIEWEKGSSINKYTINGEEHTKVGKDVPPQVQEWGFKDVRVNDDVLEVQFAKQHKYLFLLDKSGGFVADFISKITKVDVLSGAAKDCESDLRSNSESIKATDSEIAQLATDISKFENLDACGVNVGNIFDAQREMTAKQKTIDEVTQDCVELDQHKALLTFLKAIPQVDSYTFDVNALKQLHAWTVEVDDKKKEYIELKKVTACTVPEVNADIPLLRDMDAYLRLALKTNVAFPSVTPLTLDLSDVKEIGAWANEIDVLTRDVERADRDSDDASTKLMGLLKERETLEEQLGVCPLCKQGIVPSHAHIHDEQLIQ